MSNLECVPIGGPEEQRQKLYNALIRGLLSPDVDDSGDALYLTGTLPDGEPFRVSDYLSYWLESPPEFHAPDIRRERLRGNVAGIDLEIGESGNRRGVYIIGRVVDMNPSHLHSFVPKEDLADLESEVPFVYEVGKRAVERPLEVPHIVAVYQHLEQYS